MLRNFDVNANSSKNTTADFKNSLEIIGLIYKTVITNSNNDRYINISSYPR